MAAAHPDARDLDRDDVIDGRLLLPATKFACDSYYHVCRDAPWQEGMCASLSLIHISEPTRPY